MPDQFYDLAPIEFETALEDYKNVSEDKQRFELEKMRIQTLYLFNTQVKNPVTDVRKFMPFEWDKTVIYIPTNEDWQYFDNIVKKWQAKQSTN